MHATAYHRGLHLGPEDIYDASAHCPVCLSARPRQATLVIQDHPRVQMLQCPACGACSASHMPRPSVLDAYYVRYYTGSGKVTFGQPMRFARRLFTELRELPRAGPIRILDFGGGDGSLAVAIARLLRERGEGPQEMNIDLVDYQEAHAAEFPGIRITGYKALAQVQGPYDLILASAILEHIPRAHEAIRQLVAMAAPGAFFYARTPFIVPIARLVRRLDITYPAHVHDLGSAFWNRFIETFELRATTVASRPSPIETTVWRHPLRTLLAASLKLPAQIEQGLRGHRPTMWWNFVGGWEVILRFNDGDAKKPSNRPAP